MSFDFLDPQLRPLCDRFPPFTVNAQTLVSIRQSLPEMVPSPVLPDMVSCRDQCVPGWRGAPDVRLKIWEKPDSNKSRPALLHLHGGGYVLGNPETMAGQCGCWADRYGALVVSVDYRLAPEVKAPGQVEDAYAALGWMVKQAVDLRIDTHRIAVVGESAGGGLAAALALMVRDRREYHLCHQHLIYPMLDDRTALRTDIPAHIGEHVWNRDSNAFGWESLLGHPPGQAETACYAVPARCSDLSDLPPAFLAVGSLDLFLEENIAYAQGLMYAGVATELHVYAGAPHNFMMIETAEISQRYFRDSDRALHHGLGVKG